MWLKKIMYFWILEEAWERLASPKPPLMKKKVLTSCKKMGSTIIREAEKNTVCYRGVKNENKNL